MNSENTEELRQAIIDMAVEAWRFRKVFEKAMSKLDPGESSRYFGQFNWFMKKVNFSLGTAGMRIVNVENKPYDIGMAVTALNLDDFEPDVPLYVEQMLEPIIMDESNVLKAGTVLLGRIE